MYLGPHGITLLWMLLTFVNIDQKADWLALRRWHLQFDRVDTDLSSSPE